jgi:hypothetical protein
MLPLILVLKLYKDYNEKIVIDKELSGKFGIFNEFIFKNFEFNDLNEETFFLAKNIIK